jgi:hypothetical protein
VNNLLFVGTGNWGPGPTPTPEARDAPAPSSPGQFSPGRASFVDLKYLKRKNQGSQFFANECTFIRYSILTKLKLHAKRVMPI